MFRAIFCPSSGV